jgi:hypothetical protein
MGQDHAFEPPTIAVLVGPTVVDPRGAHLHLAGSREDLALPGVASLVPPLTFGSLDVVGHLGFEGFGGILLAPWRAISSREWLARTLAMPASDGA